MQAARVREHFAAMIRDANDPPARVEECSCPCHVAGEKCDDCRTENDPLPERKYACVGGIVYDFGGWGFDESE
jgi:hypothetical protein